MRRRVRKGEDVPQKAQAHTQEEGLEKELEICVLGVSRESPSHSHGGKGVSLTMEESEKHSQKRVEARAHSVRVSLECLLWERECAREMFSEIKKISVSVYAQLKM